MPPLPSLSPFIPALILCHYPLSHVTLCFCSRLLHPPTSFSRTDKQRKYHIYVPTSSYSLVFPVSRPITIVLPLLPLNRSVSPIFLSASTDLVPPSLLLPLFLSPSALIDKYPLFSGFLFFRLLSLRFFFTNAVVLPMDEQFDDGLMLMVCNM